MNQLKKWVKTLQQALFNLLPQMAPGTYEKMKAKLENYVKTFQDPQLDGNGSPSRKQLTKRTEEDASDDDVEDVRIQMPLGEGVLKVNLGIPITVVVTKADLLQHGEKAKFLEENLEFIQKHIRRYALQYGASVVFVSAATNKNLEVLY